MLVADDDAESRAAYVSAFRAAGWDVIEAVDGRDALVKALTRPPFVVLASLRLPYIDGIALSQILRRDHTTASVPILIIANETGTNAMNRALSAGASGVLVKPIAPNAIVDALRLLIEPPVEGEPARSGRPATRPIMSKAHQRLTTTHPPVPPPTLTCPICDRKLTYEDSYIGGVSRRRAEQWDSFRCATCGAFQYRHRTRKLRRV